MTNIQLPSGWPRMTSVLSPCVAGWWAERPCAMQDGQSFAGFDNGPCVESHASATWEETR